MLALAFPYRATPRRPWTARSATSVASRHKREEAIAYNSVAESASQPHEAAHEAREIVGCTKIVHFSSTRALGAGRTLRSPPTTVSRARDSTLRTPGWSNGRARAMGYRIQRMPQTVGRLNEDSQDRSEKGMEDLGPIHEP